MFLIILEFDYRRLVAWLPTLGSVATKAWYWRYQALVLSVPSLGTEMVLWNMLFFLLCFTRFFVTLQDFSAFLCIKAVWGIEENLGYEMATVLDSTFCYEMHQRTPDAKPPAVLWLIIGCKDSLFFWISQIYLLLFSSELAQCLWIVIGASFVAPARKVRIRLRPSTVMICRLSYSITIQLPCPVDPSRSMNLNDLSLLICFWTAVTDIPILFAISLLVI